MIILSACSKPCGTLLAATNTGLPKQLIEGQIGPVTFAGIGDGLASVDVSWRDPEWREVWAELIETIRRAAAAPRRSTGALCH